MNTSFARQLVKKIADENTHVMEDGLNISEASGTIDSGSLSLNAALSADIYGGIQDNKIVAFAGEEATGKTFFALALCHAFQQNHSDGIVIYYDTESAVTKKMMREHGVDTERVVLCEKQTIQDFKTHLLKLLNEYNKNKDENPKMMVVLDSLGNLSTLKEMEDSLAGDEKVDMTKPKIIKAAFRTLAMELARNYVPLVVTNHVYTMVTAYGAPKEMSGGSGLKYAASQIIYLSKKKDALEEEGGGNVITALIKKSRFTREGKKIETRISHNKGLDRYYGILPIAAGHGLIEKVGNKWKFQNGDMAFEKSIYKNPEKYFTKEFLDQLQICAQKEFSYGGYVEEETPEEVVNED